MITEKNAQMAIARLFNHNRNIIIPNLFFSDYEMDLFILSQARYVTEIEIKTNMKDWLNDAKKTKWSCPTRDKVCKFYYAVPAKLIESIPEFVREHVGLISLGYNESMDRCTASMVREAQRKSSYKATDSEVIKHLMSTYHRFWNLNNTLYRDSINDR